MTHHKRTTCRACSGTNLKRFLELGPTPLANSFLRSPEEFAGEASYPLDVYFCADCSLVQLLDVISPEVLFRDYIYVTGTSETIAEHNRGYAAAVTDLLGLGPDDLVVEVASNDGSLLARFKDLGVRTLGVEPATNIAEMARERGIETENVFFGREEAGRLRADHGPARAVIGNNVLAHVDDTQGFLAGAKTLIDGDGLVIVEVPYLGEMLDRLEYDTVYHEHLCYFSVSALMRLCESVGLRLRRVDFVPVHGGSIRIYAGHVETGADHAPEVVEISEREMADRFGEFSTYEEFASRVEKNRADLLALLRRLKDEGAEIAGYGAPAKGNTLLNYCRIDTALISYTVDRNPMKVGLYTPGMHLPVLPAHTLLERMPDYVVILAWNFADEIMAQQKEYSERGGKFIIPIPEARIVS